jgi:single-stranded DNA-binding protein
MKIGVNFKIDVSKIDKALLHKGEKGVYLDATVFIDQENPSQYGDHGMVTQDVSKEAREAGTKGNILGNVKVFWTGESQQNSQSPSNGQSQPANPHGSGNPQAAPSNFDNFDDDIPF